MPMRAQLLVILYRFVYCAPGRKRRHRLPDFSHSTLGIQCGYAVPVNRE